MTTLVLGIVQLATYVDVIIRFPYTLYRYRTQSSNIQFVYVQCVPVKNQTTPFSPVKNVSSLLNRMPRSVNTNDTHRILCVLTAKEPVTWCAQSIYIRTYIRFHMCGIKHSEDDALCVGHCPNLETMKRGIRNRRDKETMSHEIYAPDCFPFKAETYLTSSGSKLFSLILF